MSKGSKLADRYLLSSPIAESPRALVWEAFDERLERLVAVKVLKDDASTDRAMSERFVEAAHAAARLNHPNIVGVYDTGKHRGQPFVAMEYMGGGTLAEMLLRAPLSTGQAAIVGEAACEALEHAHSKGVAHGSLVPSNVLFTSSGHPKLSDFSIPSAGPIQKEEDLVAVGRLLYEILARRPPVADSSGRFARPSDFRSNIPRAWDEVVLRALGADASGFEHAGDMRVTIARLAQREERPAAADAARLQTRPESFVRAEGRWLLRLALVILLVAAVALIALNLSGRGPLPNLFGGDREARMVTPSSLGIYDPPEAGGNANENNDDVDQAFDGDPKTVWQTEWYRTAELGGAKPGVGLTVDLGSAILLDRIEVDSVAGGWMGSIRSSDDNFNWKAPEPSIRVESSHSFEAAGRHRYWMIWITGLVQTPGQGRADLPYSVGFKEVRLWAR